MNRFIPRPKVIKPRTQTQYMCACGVLATYHLNPYTGGLVNDESVHHYCARCWEDACRRAAQDAHSSSAETELARRRMHAK